MGINMLLGTGIDIIEIERIQKAIDGWGDNFLRHVFHEEEIKYAKSHKNPIQHYAARFAANDGHARRRLPRQTEDVDFRKLSRVG